MNQFSFERLEVWKDSRDLAKNIYLVSKGFPLEERFGIVSQIRRSAVSVSSNIVEGSYRKSPKDKLNFMNIAFSSLMELLSQIIICRDLDYINDEQLIKLRQSIEKISNKLYALSNYFNKSIDKKQNNDITT